MLSDTSAAAGTDTLTVKTSDQGNTGAERNPHSARRRDAAALRTPRSTGRVGCHDRTCGAQGQHRQAAKAMGTGLGFGGRNPVAGRWQFPRLRRGGTRGWLRWSERPRRTKIPSWISSCVQSAKATSISCLPCTPKGRVPEMAPVLWPDAAKQAFLARQSARCCPVRIGLVTLPNDSTRRDPCAIACLPSSRFSVPV